MPMQRGAGPEVMAEGHLGGVAFHGGASETASGGRADHTQPHAPAKGLPTSGALLPSHSVLPIRIVHLHSDACRTFDVSLGHPAASRFP